MAKKDRHEKQVLAVFVSGTLLVATLVAANITTNLRSRASDSSTNFNIGSILLGRTPKNNAKCGDSCTPGPANTTGCKTGLICHPTLKKCYSTTDQTQECKKIFAQVIAEYPGQAKYCDTCIPSADMRTDPTYGCQLGLRCVPVYDNSSGQTISKCYCEPGSNNPDCDGTNTTSSNECKVIPTSNPQIGRP